MTQQSVWQAVRRSALDAQAALRTDRADRERRLEGLAAAVLTALGERDALVREASGALVGRCWRCSPCFRGSRSARRGVFSKSSGCCGMRNRSYAISAITEHAPCLTGLPSRHWEKIQHVRARATRRGRHRRA